MGSLAGLPSCPGDYNGDSTINGADLSQLLNAWGTFRPEFDLTGDDFINGADLTFLLGDWGPGDC